MNRDMTTGVSERVLYGALLALAAKGVSFGWWSSDMAAYIAGGGVTLLGGVYAWWINRPGKLMDAAAAQMPKNAKLVITTQDTASWQDKEAAHQLAGSAGDNVVAKVIV